MNQKQRDLLCNMVDAEADRVRTQLSERLPFQQLRLNGCAGIVFIDTINEHMKEDIFKLLSVKHQKQHTELVKRSKILREQKKDLDSAWSIFQLVIGEIGQQEYKILQLAKQNLAESVRQAIIEIQFTENTQQVKKILSSLPTVDQLLDQEFSK